MKSDAWYALAPGAWYALGPFRFEKAVTEREAREYIRNWAVLRNLRGWKIWKAELKNRV